MTTGIEPGETAREAMPHAYGLLHATLLYVSDARLPVHDVEGLAEQAAGRNRLDSVTGLLCFDGERFLQYLEGPVEAIDDLFARLSLDHRHADLEVLFFSKYNGVLRFGAWDLAYLQVEGRRSIASLRGLRSVAALEAFESLLAAQPAMRYARIDEGRQRTPAV